MPALAEPLGRRAWVITGTKVKRSFSRASPSKSAANGASAAVRFTWNRVMSWATWSCVAWAMMLRTGVIPIPPMMNTAGVVSDLCRVKLPYAASSSTTVPRGAPSTPA